MSLEGGFLGHDSVSACWMIFGGATTRPIRSGVTFAQSNSLQGSLAGLLAVRRRTRPPLSDLFEEGELLSFPGRRGKHTPVRDTLTYRSFRTQRASMFDSRDAVRTRPVDGQYFVSMSNISYHQTILHVTRREWLCQWPDDWRCRHGAKAAERSWASHVFSQAFEA